MTTASGPLREGTCTRAAKRRLARRGQADAEVAAAACAPSKLQRLPEAQEPCLGAACDLCMYVRWTTAQGATRLARMPLDPIAGVSDLRSLFRRLIHGAFPGGDEALPDYLTCPAYYKFAPAEDFVSLPGDAACTQFRLVASVGGYEETVAERELGAAPDPARNLLVTIAQFESAPVEVGDGREVVAQLVAYPAICVRREFLDAELSRLREEAAARQEGAPSPTASSGGGDSNMAAVGAACSLSS